ncbi:MAG TPA: hypothetical protein DD381_05925 [Lentisphaeria bacterium]|nr:MAG: hypothetical protein A2X47_14180 [Lentisphaerae bacterium GWF2_38_69]HBM15863.1 hypothetical protein [Lentisphaeria bacterium]
MKILKFTACLTAFFMLAMGINAALVTKDFAVTNTNMEGLGSLRAAVNDAIKYKATCGDDILLTENIIFDIPTENKNEVPVIKIPSDLRINFPNDCGRNSFNFNINPKDYSGKVKQTVTFDFGNMEFDNFISLYGDLHIFNVNFINAKISNSNQSFIHILQASSKKESSFLNLTQCTFSNFERLTSGEPSLQGPYLIDFWSQGYDRGNAFWCINCKFNNISDLPIQARYKIVLFIGCYFTGNTITDSDDPQIIVEANKELNFGFYGNYIEHNNYPRVNTLYKIIPQGAPEINQEIRDNTYEDNIFAPGGTK